MAIELLSATGPSPALGGATLMQAHMIGSTILLQKLSKDFESELAIKDSHVVELRDKIFSLLTQGKD